jgi:4-amino-4-deoxy-L-arabinose transferase-like glycosyltransferase
VSRPWLAFILVAFCFPLFVGLGRTDLETDEAIYSFAVDRILEVGDWLEPKSSPGESDIFLEKPPLKFWIVAAPIKAGLLPHDEFGLRFWDAVAGSAAFAYVFAIGSLLAGPVCGVVAVLLLFIHQPLVFVHGLRTNNMDAALVLSYCAGVFHFLRWSALDAPRPRRRHALLAALFFVLGFMTKFVAALFLPATLGLVTLLSPRCRARLLEDWRTWAAAALVVVALCAPWFLYAHVRFGWLFWETILGEHVFRRMTGFLDPMHVHPWYWYLDQMWSEFVRQRMQWLMVAGAAVLLVQTVRRRWFEGAVVLAWATVPMVLISAGTSKLYHYAYPFLPPLTLAAGYLVALVMLLAPAPLRRLLEWADDQLARFWAGFAGEGKTAGRVRVASAVVIGLLALLAIATTLTGGVRVEFNGTTLLKNSSALRPIVLIALLGVLTRTSARTARVIVALLLFSAGPASAYRRQIEQLPTGKHPIRTASECVQRVQAASGSRLGILMDQPEWHPLYYYFRRVRPVSLTAPPLDPRIDVALTDPAGSRPILLNEATWHRYLAQRSVERPGTTVSPPMLGFLNSVLLLPGPYNVCSSEAVLLTPR